MRRIALVLTAAAIFSLGATSTTDCLSALLPIFTPSVGISIHVVNDAYYPVTAQLVTATAASADQTVVLAADDEDSSDTKDDEETSDTQAGQIDPGEETRIATVLCATITGPIALKATVKDDSGTEFSATSSKLYYGAHYSCGDRINFIVRPAAMVGIVVGYKVIPGQADLDLSDE